MRFTRCYMNVSASQMVLVEGSCLCEECKIVLDTLQQLCMSVNLPHLAE